MTFLIETLFAPRPPVEDPWGAGMKFWVLPNLHPRVRDAVDAKQQRKAGRELLRAVSARLADEGRKLTLSELREQLVDGEISWESVVDAMGEDGLGDLFAAQSAPEMAAARLARWEGVNDTDGQPVVLTHEAAVDLFNTPAVIPPGEPLAELVSVGAALASLVIRESLDAQAEREIAEAQAGKNSPTSGGGGSASGAASAGRSTGGKRRRKSRG